MDLTNNTKAILEAIPDAILIVNEAGVIVFANTQADLLFRYPNGRLLGKSVDLLVPVQYRAQHAVDRVQFTKNARTRPMGSGLDIVALRSDGTELPVQISLSTLPSDQGPVVCSAIRDDSEQKNMEEALRVARNDAERADRAKSVLLSAASHDLRQPLQTLNILNAVLAEKDSGRFAATIAQQADVLDAMRISLDGLLNIGRLESGAIMPSIVACQLQPIFDRLESEFRPQAENRGLAFRIDNCDCSVSTDPVLLEQILQNLISNAIGCTNRGSVRLRCQAGDNVQIDVIDTGVGVPDDKIDSIFEEFFRIEGEPEAGEGLGLGLAIVKRFAGLLSHPISVESRLGEGTMFTVTVPCADEGSCRPRVG